MLLYYMSITLAITANVFYYFIQKSTPNNANPILTLFITYFTAMITCAVIYPFYPNSENLLDSFKRLNWTSLALGFTIVGLETGFLLAYRSGWNISTAGVFANVIVALILIPVGILAFKEHLKPVNVAGIALCIAGLLLISRK
jgi:uncharacterized membrane protein